MGPPKNCLFQGAEFNAQFFLAEAATHVCKALVIATANGKTGKTRDYLGRFL